MSEWQSSVEIPARQRRGHVKTLGAATKDQEPPEGQEDGPPATGSHPDDSWQNLGQKKVTSLLSKI